jgi:hypothetical protein
MTERKNKWFVFLQWQELFPFKKSTQLLSRLRAVFSFYIKSCDFPENRKNFHLSEDVFAMLNLFIMSLMIIIYRMHHMYFSHFTIAKVKKIV